MALLVFPQPPDADDYDGERRWRKDCKRETIEARHRRLGKLGPALGDLAALRHLDVGDTEIEAFEGGDRTVDIAKRVVQRGGRDAHNVWLARITDDAALAQRLLEPPHR